MYTYIYIPSSNRTSPLQKPHLRFLAQAGPGTICRGGAFLGRAAQWISGHRPDLWLFYGHLMVI